MKPTGPLRYHYRDIPTITSDIINHHHHLIYLAGASASGKSHIGEELVRQLSESGKKVLLISADNYYSNDSSLKYLLYGTFDHPKLVDYELLQSDIAGYFMTGRIAIPSYSFVEKRRTHRTQMDEQYDIVIVEGLYTIDQLHDTIPTQKGEISAYKIFVDAPSEEVIFRRLIRDQSRVKEPLHAIVGVMAHVFPMWTLFGQTQEDHTDCIIINDYHIIEKEGISSVWSLKEDATIPPWPKEKQYNMIDYIYNDSNDDTGKIIISEVYLDGKDLLDHVIIHKRNNDPRLDHMTYASISMSLYEPGSSTALHTLLQLAGLDYEGTYPKTVSYYHNPTDPTNPIVIKEKFGVRYQLTG